MQADFDPIVEIAQMTVAYWERLGRVEAQLSAQRPQQRLRNTVRLAAEPARENLAQALFDSQHGDWDGVVGRSLSPRHDIRVAFLLPRDDI